MRHSLLKLSLILPGLLILCFCSSGNLDADEDSVLSSADKKALRLIQKYNPRLELGRTCLISDGAPSVCMLEGIHRDFETTFQNKPRAVFTYYPDETMLRFDFDEGTALRGKIVYQVYGNNLLQSEWMCGTSGCSLEVRLNGKRK